MFEPLAVLSVFLLYVGFLFLIALWVERKSGTDRSLVRNPVVYSLSLAIYCTSWTFYGSVGKAATSGMLFLTIYLGPTLSIMLGWIILRKLVRLKNSHHISSIADFISARYGRSERLAGIATIVALLGTTPYIALQLKAITSTFTIITAPVDVSNLWIGHNVNLIVIGLMVIFTIVFGVRRLDPTERHEGMIMVLFVESLVKLAAFLAAGIFVTYFMYDGFGDILQRLANSPFQEMLSAGGTNTSTYITWTTYLILAMSAILFLPRQFHVAVVENSNEQHIRTAMWLFPLYMFLINIFVFPIAAGGLMQGYPLQQADTFVLGLPLHHGSPLLAILVFIGGTSAATGMIMVSAMTLSTMISNHLLLPFVAQVKQLSFLRRYLLQCRWVAVAVVLALGYWFEQSVGESNMLVNIGMISFAAVLQFAPAMLGGLFWRKGNKNGALWGLSTGFVLWIYTLIIPAFVRSGWLPISLLEHGPWGIKLLNPEQLFGLAGFDYMSHAVFWTMLFNVGLYILVSLSSQQSEEEQGLAREFTGILTPRSSLQQPTTQKEVYVDMAQKTREIKNLLNQYLGPVKTILTLQQCMDAALIDDESQISITKLADLHNEVKKHLAGSIGAAAAHKAMKEEISFTKVESRELSDVYGRILARLKVPPDELRMKTDYYQERETLLINHAQELEAKVHQLDKQIRVRQQTEQALRNSERRFRDLAEMLPEMVFETDRNIMLTFANNRAFELTGYSNKDIKRGLNGLELLIPEDRDQARANMAARKKGEDTGTVEYQALKKDGSTFPVLFHASSIYKDGELIGLRGIMIDITERKRALAEKTRIEKQLHQGRRVEAIGRLAGGVAHDLNNLLTPVLLYAEMLLDDFSPGDDRKRSVNEILSAGIRARDLVGQLLAFSRKQSLESKPLNINKILAGFGKLLRRTIREDILIDMILGSVDKLVMADVGQLEQVIMNLCINAQDAMPEGGRLTLTTNLVVLDAQITAGRSGIEPGEYVLLTISDTGLGMDEEIQQHIFEPFFSTKGEYGTGLGLATVYGIVKQHGGNVLFNSETDAGTTFEIYLPVTENTTREEQLPAIEQVKLSGSETILLVEDDDEVRDLTGSILGKQGYHVLLAENGVNALQVLDTYERPVHLLLTDVIMPEMNGKVLYMKAIQKHPDLKVLYMSGYTDDVISHQGILDDDIAFIQKPFSLQGLASKVREALDSAR